jgi:multidrug efflux pump subunit AcrA (membrane-fusion protein)
LENKIRAVLLTTAGVLTAMLFWSWKHRPPEAVLVRTAAAETQDIYNSVTIFGTVESAESTAVCPAKNGVVSAVYAATGDTVQKGDILCTLTDIGRSQTAADYWQTAQSVFAISGTVNTVTAEDAHALYAPMDGTVLTVPQTGESVSVDMPCIQIANPDKLRVRAQSPELYVGELAVGQRANITFSAVDGTFHAELTAIAPAAVKTFSLTNEDAEATVEVLLDLNGSTENLRPGYSATVKVFTDHRYDAAVVPYEAICQRGEQEFVFCVQDGHAVQCAVQTGYLLEDTVEIIDGLPTGVSVILSPPDELTDGDPVEVQT